MGLFQGSGRKHGRAGQALVTAQWPGQVWRPYRTRPLELGSLREDSGEVLGGQPMAHPPPPHSDPVPPHETLALCSEDMGALGPRPWASRCSHTRSQHSRMATRTSAHSGHAQMPLPSPCTPQAPLAPTDSCFPSLFNPHGVDLQQCCSLETKLFGFRVPLGINSTSCGPGLTIWPDLGPTAGRGMGAGAPGWAWTPPTRQGPRTAG